MLDDVFSILESTPQKLRLEISPLSLRQMKAPPAPNKWSVQTILAHLDDAEGAGMRARAQAMIDQDVPALPSFNQEERVVRMGYDRTDPWKTFAAFARKRRANLKWLRKIRPAQLKRKGLHEELGEITVENLLNEWAFHDLGHLKQIMEVKRYALYPHLGNFVKYYKLS